MKKQISCVIRSYKERIIRYHREHTPCQLRRALSIKVRYVVVIVMLIIFFCQNATAKIIRVSFDFPSIEKAIQHAQEGDIIRVCEGTYFEHVVMKEKISLVGGWKKDFSERNISSYQTIIDGSKEEGSVISAAPGVTIDGFTIIHGTLKKIEETGEEFGSGIYCESLCDVLIQNNKICHNEPSAISCTKSSCTMLNNDISQSKKAGIHLVDGSSAVIKGNTIRDNDMAGISCKAYESSLEEKNEKMSTFHIQGNRIYCNKKAGINAHGGKGTVLNNIIFKNKGSGIYCVQELIEIINNTIVENSMNGVIMNDPNVLVIIKNNIIAYNKESGILAAKGEYDHNLLFHNGLYLLNNPRFLPCIRSQHSGYEDEESYVKKAHLIADPLFVSKESYNYHIRPGSPAIDKGDPLPKYNDVNFPPSLGTERNDLGAYGGPFSFSEKQGPNSPPLAITQSEHHGYVGDIISLDGTKSYDPDGDAIYYLWHLLNAPPGTMTSLPHINAPKISFKLDQPGDYVIGLRVTDRWGAKAKESQVKIYAEDNHPPEAYAGENIEDAAIGDVIELYGDLSNDDDDDPLSYQWRMSFRPLASKAVLSESKESICTLKVDVPGSYVIELIVNDGKVNSLPYTLLISTMHKAQDKKRYVPEQYPTIQCAIDAAEGGDQIIVNSGTYRENIYINKNIDLIGINWPVITGGNEVVGPTNIIKIGYVGVNAGKVTGFVISGMDLENVVHGLSICDSAPTIYGNRFTNNSYNALGIHGRGEITKHIRIYENLFYNNGAGVGISKGACARIYHNEIFNNKVFGIGCRGYASPLIYDNSIHDNLIGIGMREPASPCIENNFIYNNKSGIRISPISTIDLLSDYEITIKNNLIFKNEYNGIWVTSFNKGKIKIAYNTIDHNNLAADRRRGGGIVLGWPWPGDYQVIVRNNIITNNQGAGIINYKGAEGRLKNGVRIDNNCNNVWNNGKYNYKDCHFGINDISEDPLFQSLPSSDSDIFSYFLSHTQTGHPVDSPGLNCEECTLSPDLQLDAETKSTRVDWKPDTDGLNIGFHYPLTMSPLLSKLHPVKN
ncbi:MAG: right-handed parallel beta-helix repeat-containing protein [bacterium]